MPLIRSALQVALVCFCLMGGGTAAARTVRVSWMPSPDPTVAGYRIYVRPLTGTWGRPRNAGLPHRRADGTLRTLVRRLKVTRGYAFAVAAYQRGGTESPLSNEIRLDGARGCHRDADCDDGNACTTHEHCRAGVCVSTPVVCPDPGPCGTAACHPAVGCVTTALPDGTACAPVDPCGTGTCSAGSCIPDGGSAASAGVLDVDRLILRRVGQHARVAASGTFPLSGGFDPRGSGVTVDLRTADGTVRYRAAIPPRVVRANGRGGVFHYAGGRAHQSADTGGVLTRLSFRPDGPVIRVRMHAILGSMPEGARSELGWGVRLGGLCVRDAHLACTAARAHRLHCR